MNGSPAAPRRRALGFFAILAPLSASCECRSAAAVDDRATILRLEQELNDAAPHADTAVYERLLAEDFAGQWADGTRSDKKETTADLASGHDSYQRARSAAGAGWADTTSSTSGSGETEGGRSSPSRASGCRKR